MLVAQSVFAANPIIPDTKLTPGDVVTNSVVEICQHGYAKRVRNVPSKVKKQVFIEYFGAIPQHPGDYEIDHLISLELGGSNSISNLWPQSYSGQWNAHTKDRLEDHLALLVRNELSLHGEFAASNRLRQAQSEISTNWTNTYLHYFASPTNH